MRTEAQQNALLSELLASLDQDPLWIGLCGEFYHAPNWPSFMANQEAVSLFLLWTYAPLLRAALVGDRKEQLKEKVVYVCAEGAGGFKTRLRAYAASHNISLGELPAVIADAPNLLEQSDAAALYGAIIKWGKPDVCCHRYSQCYDAWRERKFR